MWTYRPCQEVLSDVQYYGFSRANSKSARALAVSSGRAVGRPSGSVKSTTGSSSKVQSTQRPQRTQTRIFAMMADEAQANPDSMTGIIFVFGEPARVLFDFGACRSFISTSFALHTN